MKNWSKSILMVVCTILAFGIWAVPASAQVEYHGPEQQNYPTSCLDLYGDPFVNCFSDSGATTDPYGNPLSDCQIYYNKCAKGCSDQQNAALTACSRIQDPVAQADCVANANLNAQSCQAACLSNAQSGYCPR